MRSRTISAVGNWPRILPDWYIRSAKPIRLPGQGSEPEPDRCVVRGAIRDYGEYHPGPADIALVVEVADSSLADDRKLADGVYGPAGIPVYWIVNVGAAGSRSIPARARRDTGRPRSSSRVSRCPS